MLSNFKLLSYNVNGSSNLAGLNQLIDIHRPTLIFLQEVLVTAVQCQALLPRHYLCEVNNDPDNPTRPGNAVIWRDSLDVTVTNIVTCRLQIIKCHNISYINCYPPSGTNGQRGRRALFGVDLVNVIASCNTRPVLVGDWNCVIRPQDIGEI